MIKLFKIPDCPHCKEMQDLLTDKNIEFQIVDIRENESIGENLLALVESQTGKKDLEVPIVLVNKQLLIPGSSFDGVKDGADLVEKLNKA